MRPILRPLLLPLALAATLAATPDAPPPGPPAAVAVGIEERLGRTIPLDLTLRDEDNQPVTLRSLVNKPTILTLNYFRCAGICTPQLTGVAEVLNHTQADPGKAFQVITVSFDERDTAEVASKKRMNYLRSLTRPFPPEAWRFLTGDSATTQALADSVGFHYQRQGKDFVHPAAIMFLSPQGVVTRYMYGVSFLPADLQMAVTEAAKGEPRPTISKWLSICYSYDPQGRQYVFSATRTAAVLTVLAAVIFVTVLLLRNRRRMGGSDGS